jgi:DNA invertase Pin-like site-specific DNA recombinase
MSADLQKVNAGHLKRNAYLYIRQSTLRQVLENVESQASIRASAKSCRARLVE